MPIQPNFDLTKLITSWTKYDIVQVMGVAESVESIEAYKNKEIVINEPILKSFLNIKSLRSKTPKYWHSIQEFPREKGLFSLFSIIFTHHRVITTFAQSSNRNKGGILEVYSGDKMFTNMRSVLIESGASLPSYRRSTEVPYDFSLLFECGPVGILAKELLLDRLSLVFNQHVSEKDLTDISELNGFHKTLGLTSTELFRWFKGEAITTKGEHRYIKTLKVNKFYSIDEVVVNLENSKEVYFLGENGDGKSLVLMAFFLAFNGDFVINETERKETGSVIDLITSAKDAVLNGEDNFSREYSIGKSVVLSNLFAYGTHRGRYSKVENPEKYGFMSLFDIDQTLINPIAWLKEQKAIEVEKLLEQSTSSSSKQNSVTIKVKYLENLLFDILERNVEVKIDVDSILFKEKGVYISFDQLSEGYRSILIFVVDLLVRLTRYSDEHSVDIENISGVVLIDEIDQHLHPSWQKVIVRRLRESFPKVQFIMTTHSPTIIQGASDDSIIYRVYRDKNTGATKISDAVFRKDLDELMVNSLITHPIFGLETARLDGNNENADTSDDYLHYRISKHVREELHRMRTAGANFVSDEEIDELIKAIIRNELGDEKD